MKCDYRDGPRLGLEGERDAQFSDIHALVTHYRSGVRKQKFCIHDILQGA